MKQALLAENGPRPLASAARAARRSAVLEQAAVEFRRAGVAGADLPMIARSVGLSRASLYNYCTGREDLARQCYLETLGQIRKRLDERDEAADCLAQILAFVRTALAGEHAIAAIAGELDLLSDDLRADVEDAQREMFATLEAVISRGIAQRSIRPCDPQLVARMIWGLIVWAPVGGLWTGRNEKTLADRLADELPTLIERGVAARHSTGTCPALAGQLPARPEERVEEIAKTASALFNRRGIEGVSLDDVAEAMSRTKGLVYHHFESKGALVSACFDRGFDIYDQIMAQARAQESAIEQTRWAVSLNVQAQLEDLYPLSLGMPFQRLPEAAQAAYAKRSSALLDQSIGIAVQGMNDGSLRQFDAESISLVSAGTFLFLARWMPSDDIDPVRLGADVADLYLHGLKAP